MYNLRQRRTLFRYAVVATALAATAILFGIPAKAYEQQHLPTNPYGQIEFVMPSGNIGCIFTPDGGTPVYGTLDGLAEISCDRVEPDYIRAVLGSAGEGAILDDVGEMSCCGTGPVFHYDHFAQLGPFQCLSTRKGLTCARDDGHGFFLSRALVEAR